MKLEKYFVTPDEVKKKKADLWKKNGYGGIKGKDLTSDDIEFIQSERDKLADNIRRQRVSDEEMVNLLKWAGQDGEHVGKDFRRLNSTGLEADKSYISAKLASRVAEREYELAKEEADRLQNMDNQEYAKELLKNFVNKHKKGLYLGAGIAGAAGLGYGGYRLYKHYKNKKKNDNTEK